MNPVDIRPQTAEEFRYWSKVEYIGATWQQCLDWMGAGSNTNHNSARAGKYGRFEFQGRNQPAHRVAWQLLCGPLTPDQHLDHLCENGLCQNVFHMQPKPMWENVARDPKQIAMINKAKTHCVHGHEFTEENTYLRDGHRHCKVCHHMTGKGHQRRTHCPQGHPYDEANTSFYKGSQQCKACNRERARRRRHPDA